MAIITLSSTFNDDKPVDAKISIFFFKMSLTLSERMRLRSAAEVDEDVQDFIDLLGSATFVDLLRHDTRQIVSGLGAAGFLDDPNRVNEILNNRVRRFAPSAQNPAITILAFKHRLTDAERRRIHRAAREDADVYDALDLVNSADYFDLRWPEVEAIADRIESKGLLDNDGRKAELLNNNVTEIERYMGSSWY